MYIFRSDAQMMRERGIMKLRQERELFVNVHRAAIPDEKIAYGNWWWYRHQADIAKDGALYRIRVMFK